MPIVNCGLPYELLEAQTLKTSRNKVNRYFLTTVLLHSMNSSTINDLFGRFADSNRSHRIKQSLAADTGND
jgi:hypothetical protein